MDFQIQILTDLVLVGISNFSMNYDSIKLDVNSKIITWLVDQVFKVFRCMVIQQIKNLVLGDLNNQIMALTSQMIQIPAARKV